jgi:uncharacterized membrane protein YbhN (UPF0104 family)
VVDTAAAAPVELVEERPRSRSSILARYGLGLAVTAGACVAAVGQAGGVSDSLVTLERDDLVVLGLAGVAELVSYLAVGVLLHGLLAVGGRISRRAAFGLGLVVNGLGNVLPAAPVEGVALATRSLGQRGVTTRRAITALGLLKWTTTRAFLAFVALDALVFVTVEELRRPVSPGQKALIGLAAVAVLAVLAATATLVQKRHVLEAVAVRVGALAFWRRRTAEHRRLAARQWHGEVAEVLGGHGRRWALATVAVVVAAADATCFVLCLRAAGVTVQPVFFVAVYGAAVGTTFIPFLPAGLGAMEAIVPTLLRRGGVRFHRALAGVLAFRLLATVLPAVAGAVAAVALRRRARAR